MQLNDNVLLVTKEDIYKYTQLKGNVDIDNISPFIKVAQDIEIQTVLGTILYRKILTDVQDGTLADQYLTLVSTYVQPMLIHYAMSDFMQFHGYEVSNAGILRNNPENTSLPDRLEIDTLVKRYSNIAETYRRRLIDYITLNVGLYPEYTQWQQGGQYPSSNPTNYTNWNL
jgi:hypothetical protein